MDINVAAEAIDRFVQGYAGAGGRTPTEVRCHPSGDDMNAIKIWVNLGAAADGEDLAAWCTEAEAAIRQAVPGLDAITIDLRAEAL